MKKIELPFNPDTMTVRDLKKAAETLRTILKEFDDGIAGNGVDADKVYIRALNAYQEFEVK